MSGSPPLDPAAIFAALEAHGIRYVVTGSVAAMAYGVDLDPGDLDIAPALDRANLEALGRMLGEVGAKPKFVPGWAAGPTEQECRDWRPEPADAATLDHRFVTPWGELDVVPHKAGVYEALRPRAVVVPAYGRQIPVTHVEDLIIQAESWDRPRDRARRDDLRSAAARLASGERPAALDRHPAWARMDPRGRTSSPS
jgi:hypothetical protein